MRALFESESENLLHAPQGAIASRGKWFAPVLWMLLLLFILRVLGQLLVASGHGGFLPPMERWHSGLIRYRALLACQIIIVIFYAKVCVDFSRGRGFFVAPKRRFGNVLLAFGAVYFASMVARYVVIMTLYPERRWTSGAIPIFFHLILASFLLLAGRHHRLNANIDCSRSAVQSFRTTFDTEKEFKIKHDRSDSA